MDDTTDLRNFRPRLIGLAIAAAVSAVMTWFTVHAMLDSGRGVGADPINNSTAGVLAIAIWVMTTMFSYSIIAKAREKNRLRARR